VLLATFDLHSAQQSAGVSFALVSVWPERLDFGVLQVPADNITKRDDLRAKFGEAVGLSVARIDAARMSPFPAIFVERSKQGKVQTFSRSRMQNESERAGFALPSGPGNEVLTSSSSSSLARPSTMVALRCMNRSQRRLRARSNQTQYTVASPKALRSCRVNRVSQGPLSANTSGGGSEIVPVAAFAQ
jgi:hypothetical protein